MFALVSCSSLPQLPESATNLIPESLRKNPITLPKDTKSDLQTADMERNGWYGNTPNQTPRHVGRYRATGFTRDELFLSHESCSQRDPFTGTADQQYLNAINSCPRFEERDLMVATDPDSRRTIERIAERHPFRSKLDVIFAETPQDLKQAIKQQLMRCHVYKHILFSSHGNLGVLLFDNHAHNSSQTPISRPTTVVLLRDITPCILSPRAKVQFTACAQGCGQIVRSLQRGLERILLQNPNPAHYSKIEFLFSTDLTEETRTNRFLAWVQEDRTGAIRPQNDLSVVFAVKGRALESDIPLNTIPECQNPNVRAEERSALHQRIRRVLENPFVVPR